MKKFFVLIFFMSVSVIIMAQNQIGSTGNVGIGTLTPMYPLEVYGQAWFHSMLKMDTTLIVEDSIIVNDVKIENDIIVEGDLRMAAFELNGMQANRPLFVNEGGWIMPLEDPCKSDGSGGMIPYWQHFPGMIFVDCPKDVRVGIGTNDPLQNLHVVGSQYITRSLGVGVVNPESKLDVRANLAYNDIASRFFTSTTGQLSQTNEIFMVPRLGDAGYSSISKKNDVGLIFSDNIISGQWNKSSGIVIAPANPYLTNPGIRISQIGYLGVGISDPDKRLEISNGALAISGSNGLDGTVRFLIKDNTTTNDFLKFSNNDGIQLLVDSEGKLYAHEVEVKLGSFPDYVFDDDYFLRPLFEVEEYIKENKHLPGVPDEETVVEEGLNLGEMDAILLEKVEELTLYIIEQQKQIEILQQELAKIKSN